VIDPVPKAHSEVRHYSHSGVIVASELELPEWGQCERSSLEEEPGVLIRLEPSGDAEFAGAARPTLIAAREYSLRVPKVGRFQVHEGREIHVKPLPGVELARLRPWLLGPVWGALCYQRGFFLVHASAVRVGNEAVLFCGGAGQGKSTLAVQLADRGYALVSDDLCRLDFSPQGSPVVYPSAPRVKLWSDALDELGWTDREPTPDHLRDGKFHLSVTGIGMEPAPAHALPVRTAYVLSWGEFGVRELKGMMAFRRFLPTATYRRKMLELTGQLGSHSRMCMEFLGHVPLLELTRPKDFSFSAETLDFLVAGWSRGMG
jgi:hypothetical protein